MIRQGPHDYVKKGGHRGSPRLYIECVAMKAASSRSKAKDHAEHRMKLWSEGNLDYLVHEGRIIQRQLTQTQQTQHKNDDQTARLFAKLLMEDKVREALRLSHKQR